MFTTYAAELSPHSIFGHKNTNEAFPEIIEQLGDNFGKSIPQSATDNAQMQTIYNFFFPALRLNTNICFYQSATA